MTELKFTHEGLVPQLECYSRVAQSWDMAIKEQLYNFITDCPAVGRIDSTKKN